MRFYYTHTNLAGDVLSQGVIEICNPICDYDLVRYAVPREANGRAVIWAFGKDPPEVRDSFELTLVCYNFHQNRLEFRAHVVSGLSMNIHEKSDMFFWKDAAYYVDKRRGLRVINLQDSTCSELKMFITLSTEDFDLHLQAKDPLEACLFGDETFLISVFKPGFFVRCFDANVQIANEDISYKERRKDKIK